MNLSKDIRRGEEARRLLENELLTEAFDVLEKAILHKFSTCNIHNTADMHNLRLMLDAGRLYRGYLEEIVKTGKLSTLQLEQERKQDELNKKGLKIFG